MEEKEILKLLRVRKKHLNKKVSGGKLKIRYCRNVSSTKNEFNYFVVNNNISEISFPREREEETGYMLEHSIDYKKDRLEQDILSNKAMEIIREVPVLLLHIGID